MEQLEGKALTDPSSPPSIIQVLRLTTLLNIALLATLTKKP